MMAHRVRRNPLATGGAALPARRARPRRQHPLRERVAEHAARGAPLESTGDDRQRQFAWRFLGWLLGRLLALALLFGCAWLVYDSASSERFQARMLRVSGHVLLDQTEVERVAAVGGANLFWIDRRQVEQALASLPVVRQVEVTPILPDTVDIRIIERQPTAFWVSGETTYLVDREGIILQSLDSAAEPPVACLGQPCNPRAVAGFPMIAHVDGGPLTPGARVDARLLGASATLAALLPEAGIRPLAFEWSDNAGLEVPTAEGWRARFDGRGDLGQQIGALQAVRKHLAQTRQTAEVIDVRFGDRPYFRAAAASATAPRSAHEGERQP